jgi:SAM-dependent methyltransferase
MTPMTPTGKAADDTGDTDDTDPGERRLDPSHAYERMAARFLAGRGRERDGVGVATVRTWARSLPARGTVLDVGCGPGIPISRVLLEEGLVVHGVDASPTLVAAFRQNFPDVPIVCEPAEHSAFFNRTFDGVLAWGLVFLLPRDTQVHLLERMARALVPGGRLLFTAPEQPCRWIDILTGGPSESLGAPAYWGILRAAGLDPVAEYDDEGQNHYYDAVRRESG